MIFKAPADFTDALDYLVDRELLPTALSSSEIRETWGPEVRRMSIFSARTNHAGHLQAVSDVVADVAAGKINRATARERLQTALDELGYTPEGGFPGEGPVPPAEAGDLRDLGSTARLDLMISTQTRMAANRGYLKQWESPAQRRTFPAWELIRIYPREVPRGQKRAKGGGNVDDPDNGWPSRWQKAGGSFYGGRMVALVDDPVWAALGSTELFRDGLDNPYPPFAFGSGFGLKAIDRALALKLGVIKEGDPVPGAPAGVIAPPAKPPIPSRFDKTVLRELKKSLDRELKDWDSGELLKRELDRAKGGQA